MTFDPSQQPGSNVIDVGSFTSQDIISKMSNSADANGESNRMRIDPQRAKLLAENLGYVLERVHSVAAGKKVLYTSTPSNPRPSP